MILKTFPLGMINTNSYLLIDEESKEAIIIDLGGDCQVIADEIEHYNAKLKYILNTHGHFDHVLGEKDAQDKFGVDVYIHEADKLMVENLPLQLKIFGMMSNAESPANLKTFTEQDIFKIGNKEIKVINQILEAPQKPFVAILGGAKIKDKIPVIENLIGKADTILVGGGMAYTFQKAMGGNVGTSLVDEEKIELAKKLIEKAKENNVEFVLPIDNMYAEEFSNDSKAKAIVFLTLTFKTLSIEGIIICSILLLVYFIIERNFAFSSLVTKVIDKPSFLALPVLPILWT